ncbi:TPA: hypothetical protein EYP38_03300, partial [Candidatus Micrarchaeota archaeon]|nr:hypothetical protein [Candidatus Micrarchaeota archaeon]
RYVVNDVAVKLGKPWVFVGVERWYGNVMFVSPGETPCLRCLVPEPPEERGDACDVLGVVNTAVSMTVSVAVSELIKYLLGLEPSRELMIVDSLYNEVHKVKVRRNERCPACGMRRFDFLTAEEGGRARRVCGTQAVEVYPPADVRVRLEELRRPGVLPGGVELQVASRYTAKMSVGDLEVVLFGDGRAVVHGTVDEAEALRVYDELLGALLRAGLAEEVWSARRPPQSSART